MSKHLEEIAQALVAEGKGILAADEGVSTIVKRFDSIGVESTEENRRSYREILFTAPNIEAFISGVILFDETLRQKTRDGVPFPDLLSKKGIIPGIKSDRGTTDIPGFPGEKVTEGLDGLRARCNDWRKLGAGFTKWRAVLQIGDGLPTRFCIDANARALARNAALSQEAGLVAIVEPEVTMDGPHGIEECEEATECALKSLYAHLHEQRVVLEGTLLKPNMVLQGRACNKQADVQQVAEATLRCFRRSVPAAVPGIVFLSGGQSPIEATEHLSAMNALGGGPWQISFSYGRALQEPVLQAWQGDAANKESAQKALVHRASLNGAARRGSYSGDMEAAEA